MIALILKILTRSSVHFKVILLIVQLALCSSVSLASSLSSSSSVLTFNPATIKLTNNPNQFRVSNSNYEPNKPNQSVFKSTDPVFSSSFPSSSVTASAPVTFSSSSSPSSWVSLLGLGSEVSMVNDSPEEATETPALLSPSSSSAENGDHHEDDKVESPGEGNVNLYLDSSTERTPSESSSVAPFRSVIYRCDKTQTIIDYIDGKQIVKCELFDLEKRPEEAMKAAESRKLRIIDVPFYVLHTVISRCLELERFTMQNGPSSIPSPSDSLIDSNRLNSTSDSIYAFWRGVIPGTKWCGTGDIAKDYFDLGPNWEVDLCCRAHDHCPYRLKAFRHGYGLINLAFYTRSHCSCDDEFYRCLKKSNTNLGSTLGNIYFNVMQVQCFKEEEETKCIQTRVNLKGQRECVTYAPNGSRKMVFSQNKLFD